MYCAPLTRDLFATPELLVTLLSERTRTVSVLIVVLVSLFAIQQQQFMTQ